MTKDELEALLVTGWAAVEVAIRGEQLRAQCPAHGTTREPALIKRTQAAR